MNVAEELWTVIDPEETSPEILDMFSVMPKNTIGHILREAKGMKPEAIEMFLYIANEEARTSEGRDHRFIGGHLHLAAVVVPVMAALKDEFSAPDEIMSVNYVVGTIVINLRNMLCNYWNTDLTGFALHEDNRRNFARGWAMLLFMGTSAVLDHELDQYLMWLGSKFDDFESCMEAIVTSPDKDKLALTLIAREHGVQPSPGYEREGQSSLFPESVNNRFLAKYAGQAVEILDGVNVRAEEFMYLSKKTLGPLDKAAYVHAFAELSVGMEIDSTISSQVVTLLSSLDEGSISVLRHLVGEYDLQVRSLILSALYEHSENRSVIRTNGEDEHFITNIAFIAPTFLPFFNATYAPDEDALSGEWTLETWDREIIEARDDAIWEKLISCYLFVANAEVDNSDYGDIHSLIMLMRSLAITYFVRGDEPSDDEIKLDIHLIHERMEDICRNAKLLVQGKSLSPDVINALPRD